MMKQNAEIKFLLFAFSFLFYKKGANEWTTK